MQPQKIEAGKVYRMFTDSGAMEEVKRKPALPLYCKVFCFGGGMSETPAAIISEPNQFGQQKAVYMSEYHNGFTNIDEHSRPLSKKFGIGHYYSDTFETYPEEEVREMIERAEKAVIEKATAAKEKQLADEQEVKELPTKYPHLTKVKDHAKGYFAACKDNIRADLKKNFAGFKFSVSSSHYDSISIKWTDGPTVAEVEEVTGKYTDHASDITGDYRDPAGSNFNEVFGGANYIMESREQSAEIEALKTILDEMRTNPADRWENGQILHRVFCKTSLPIGAKITGLERSSAECCSMDDLYIITFETPQTKIQAPATEKQPEPTQATGEIQMIDYSENSFALVGIGTKAIKETLKEKGGKFNRFLSCGAGWIFSKKKYYTIKTYLESLQVKA